VVILLYLCFKWFYWTIPQVYFYHNECEICFLRTWPTKWNEEIDFWNLIDSLKKFSVVPGELELQNVFQEEIKEISISYYWVKLVTSCKFNCKELKQLNEISDRCQTFHTKGYPGLAALQKFISSSRMICSRLYSDVNICFAIRVIVWSTVASRTALLATHEEYLQTYTCPANRLTFTPVTAIGVPSSWWSISGNLTIGSQLLKYGIYKLVLWDFASRKERCKGKTIILDWGSIGMFIPVQLILELFI
jgi:hypothetical protein